MLDINWFLFCISIEITGKGEISYEKEKKTKTRIECPLIISFGCKVETQLWRMNIYVPASFKTQNSENVNLTSVACSKTLVYPYMISLKIKTYWKQIKKYNGFYTEELRFKYIEQKNMCDLS